NAAGVGGQDRAGAAHLFDFAQQVALDIQVFHHGLENPVALVEVAQVVFEVAWRDQRSRVRGEEAAGFLLHGGVDPRQRGGVTLGLVGENDIQQKGRNSGICEMGGDTRTHGSGTQYGNTAEWCHWLSSWSLAEGANGELHDAPVARTPDPR